MKLEKGRTYFEIVYADPDCTMPGVRPMVYAGCDIFDEGDESLHFFQDTASVANYGLLGDGEDAMVFSFSDEELGSGIVEIDQLAEIMAQAYQRYLDCGKPKLTKG